MLEDVAPEAARPSLLESWEQFRAIALRRRWWILFLLFFCWALVWSCGWLWPSTYKSESLILIEQPKIPEQYVVPNVSVSLQDRLQSITQQILSRTRLQGVIDRFHLYPARHGLGRLLDTGDPVDQMREDIDIEPVASPDRPQELTAFKIDFSANSPRLAQEINTDLTSLFISADIRAQQQLSQSTTDFLVRQLADARAKLEQQEARLRTFQARHLGDLPSELQANVQILSGLQSELQNTQQALDGARQQRLYLESLIQQYESATAVSDVGGAGSGAAANPAATTPQVLDKELLELRSELADERARFTDQYPDVVALKDRIAQTEALRRQVLADLASRQKAASKTTNTEPAETVVNPGAPTPIMQAQSQLKANELEIKNYEKRESQLEAQIVVYQGRLNSTPETEQELADVSRGYQESKANYDSLLQKQNQSQLATELQQSQEGEQFDVLDPPSLPLKPSAPNHLLVSLGGLVLGIVVGCGFAVLMELANAPVGRKELAEIPVRVLVGIPHLSAPGEDRSMRRTRWMGVAVAVAVFAVIALGNLYSFYKG
jgi:polysaccharide biosynthesis transport protein